MLPRFPLQITPGRLPQAIPFQVGQTMWTNMPAAETEFAGILARRMRFDLTGVNKVRISARVQTAGAAGSVLRFQYSTDENTWADLTPNVAVDAIGTQVSAWDYIPGAAQADVYIRLVGSGGNGVADPTFGNIYLQLR